MLYSCSIEFALDKGGSLTKETLNILKTMLPKLNGRNWVVDTRSHMLMLGMYPAIGGWHCDAVPRYSYDVQPDLRKMDDSPHFTVTVSSREGGISNTEFITSELSLNVDTDAVWESISKQIGNKGERFFSQDGDITKLTSQTLHRATMAESRGWRFFLRCSAVCFKPLNQIRNQIQVYTDISAGW